MIRILILRRLPLKIIEQLRCLVFKRLGIFFFGIDKEVDQLKSLLLKKDLDAIMLDSYLKIDTDNLVYKVVADLKKT